jgi:hypothetical protein
MTWSTRALSARPYACHVIIYILDPRYLSKLASYDVEHSSIIRYGPTSDCSALSSFFFSASLALAAFAAFAET